MDIEFTFATAGIICIILISNVICELDSVPKEYCNQEIFNASCPANHVVIMTSALYGRMNFGRCMRENHGHVGCSTDVLPYLDEECSGYRRCDIPIPLAPYAEHPNCPSELMSYLEADYKCQKVEDKRICPHTGRSTLQIGLNSTYLSPPPKSVQSSPGSRTCPWVLSTDKGRRINITFISFSSTTDSLSSGSSSSAMQCSDFLVIRDYNTTESRPICNDHRREKILYSSKSNKVTIYLRHAGSYDPGEISSRYLLKSLAVGCKDIAPMPYAWIHRTDDVTVVKCNHTGETFFLSCTGTEWLGELHNCSKGELHGGAVDGQPTTFNYGFLLVIGIGVALGVALGIILLAAILTCFKRKKHTKAASHHTSDPLLTNDTHMSEDANSNYYERRSLATIGRSPRTLRDSIYSERVHFSPHGPPDSNILKCQTLPYTGRKVQNRDQEQREIYCTCPQAPGSVYGRALSAGSGRTSFITFKPENEHVDVYGAVPDQESNRNHSDTRSLDLIRESESQNLENMHRASLTPQLEMRRYNCNKCGVSISNCPCARNGTATMPRLTRQSTDPSMCNNKSV